MKKTILLIVVILGIAVAAYYYWEHSKPKPVATEIQVPPPVAAPKAMRQVVEASSVEAPLPQLDKSDSFVMDALAGLIGNQSLMKLFRAEHVIRNIVVTIDNLPSQRVPVRTRPLEPVSGRLETQGAEGNLTISPKNTARYTPYMSLLEMVDTEKLVNLYIHLYPLFQQAYEELGYPDKYFNDRLMAVLDHLLDAPDITEPVKLIQPKVFYLYANPDLEARSIGQKTLMRMGSDNEAKIKAKLKEIKAELLLHMHEEEVPATE